MKQIHISSKNLLHHLRNIGVLRVIKIIPVFLLSVLILSACMKDDYEEVQEELCPDVISTNPERDETTDITSDITVTFNKEMCLDAVKESFFVIMGEDTIAGEINTNDDKTFGFRPELNLKAGSSYEAIVTTDVADCFGLTLIGGDYKWTFDTDNVVPLISTNPANGDINVLRNIAIEIEFNKDINTNTISLDMFTLEDVNGNPVDIFNWEYSNRVITIHPDNLAPGTTFSATLKSGIEDLLGYFTEEDYIWNFTTGSDFQVIPRSVNLRSVNRFSVFSSDFITNSGASSSITGDVGIIPGLITNITGIDFNNDVDGNIVADSLKPVENINPALVQGKNDLAAAYLFANKANNPDPQPLSGNQFGPGIYFINSSYDIDDIITLDGEENRNAFWIFQIDGALNADSDIEIVLINGAHPNNVFWQVGDAASIGANASFIGNIMAKEGIELSDGASITGRLLVKNGGISLNTNTIVLP